MWKVATVASTKDNAVNIHHFLVNMSAHKFFFVVDAPNHAALEAAFGRYKRLGEMRFTPVKFW